MELQEIFDKVCNWQETASSFIDRLSVEYSEYNDVAQPIQVAVYEMKLGVSLVLLSALQKKFLDRIQEDNIDRVLELIYSFMRFPRGCPFEFVSISDRRRLPMFSSFDMPCITRFSERELSLLEKLITFSSDVDTEKGSVLQLKAALYNNVLVRIAHSVATAKLMDNASFRLLDKIFSGFANIWMCMKIEGKNQEDLDGQSFKFRPRACRIENVMEVDISALGKLLSSDNFIEWQELLSDTESTEMARLLCSYAVDEKNSDEYPVRHSSSIIKNKMKDQVQISELEELANHQSPGDHRHDDGDQRNVSECLVSVKRSYLSEDVYQLNRLPICEEEMGQAQDIEEASGVVKSNASALWRRYELLTTRLSHELAEQLRLVMEPTLASKLQGDYKTGKRINMKKVIPYIASHYQKDKIWLRRTKPNKRDYQVIIAVDDSHSMLESGCSEVALKALVTVCRALSQLEVGNLAVASFGKKGNIRLLQDFDQPFTGESGVKMISSLTFKQENTITDEPVVDLLTFLNKKLDAAVTNARLPSGQNPLQQLVLIIGDGRLHEKENLKRCVRDVLSSKRMVAFLILDSLQESIMDLQEVMTSQDKNNQFKISVTKYLNSFPFPYYVVLRNIEALPKTLADLLRQWFELMQNSRD
ncbi:MIDASIN 1 [Hibiscus trionum]|nr:MIDASIN 1 [Hibiscus trionum]